MVRRNELPPIEIRGEPVSAATQTAEVSRGDGNGGRWLLVAGLLLAALVAILVLERADRSEQAIRDQQDQVDQQADQQAGRTLPGPATAPGPDGSSSSPAPRLGTFERGALPTDLRGTLYGITDDDGLFELDLTTGLTREVTLEFGVAPWLVSQVVVLEEQVLIASRRQVYAVDRATLVNQRQIASGRWVVAPATGEWAALVPFGAGGGAVTVLDGEGQPRSGPALVLPSGVEVHGAVADQLVVDNGDSLQLLGLDGTPGATLGTGRFLASTNDVVARLSCVDLRCAAVVGPAGGVGSTRVDTVAPAGSWLFGPGAVFDPDGRRLALVAAGPDGALHVELHQLVGDPGGAQRSPVAPAAATPLPPLAWSADGSAVIHTSAAGLALWRPAPPGAAPGPGTPAQVAELTVHSPVLALTVSPLPPPPPPVSGPPPSFA